MSVTAHRESAGMDVLRPVAHLSDASTGAARSAANARVEWANDESSLAEHVDACEALAADAIEPNVFYEHWMLAPALRARGARDGVRIAFIYAADSGSKRLLGVFPIQIARGYKRLPLRYVRLWKHDYCFLCTPLIRPGFVGECLRSLRRALAAEPGMPRLLELRFCAADGPFRSELDAHLRQSRTPSLETDRFERAVLRPTASYDEYFQQTFDRKRRKEFKRQANRLAEAGRLECACLLPGEDAAPWISDFLRLEASGWKGESQTAFASRQSDQIFFEEIALAAHQRGRLMLSALRLDGCPLAMKFNLMAGDGGYAFKIAYDERHAAYSPGVQLELANIRWLHERPQTRWMDSCADAEHFMANRMWVGRRSISSLLIPMSASARVCVLGLATVRRLITRNAQRAKAECTGDET